MTEQQQHSDWRFYGRRMGRKLTATRQSLLDDAYPKSQLPEKQITQEHDLAPASLFDYEPEKIVLEIGFGGGEHLTGLIHQYNDKGINAGFIGIEPFVNGMASFLVDIKEQNLEKYARVWMDDAIPVAKSFEENSIDEIYVLNPDPWHKTRHHRRRIINQDNLDIFSKILKPDGKLIMSTDVPYLAEWMVTEATTHPDFTWTATCADDWRVAPEDWIDTRYQTKKAKGADKMNYLFFTRNAT